MNFKKYHVSRNLFDMSTVEDGKGIAMDGSISNYSRRCSTVTPIDVSTYSNVTLAFTASLSRTRVIYALFNNNTLVTRQTAVFSGTTIDVSSGNKLYICFYDAADFETIQKSDLSNVMLNTGSTPLPYEPYSSEVWHDTPHYIHNTSTDTITTLPAVVYPNDTTATVGLKGNMSQSGTPTPDNPVMPQGTGDKTANLFDRLTETTGCFIRKSDARIIPFEPWSISDYIAVLPNTQYTFEPNSTAGNDAGHFYYNSFKEVIGQIDSGAQTFVTPQNCAYMRFSYRNESTDIMLNLGSTALPYEPFGYFIEIEVS